MGQIYNIPFGMCFLKTLADFLKNNFNAQFPFAQASMHVWLPTNRSIIGLKESLVVKNSTPFILPTLHSLTDLESCNPFTLKEIDDLPKAIGAFERLALVMDFLPATLHVKKAFSIAEYLITLHDECIISDVSVEMLESQYDAKLYENAPAHVQDAFQNLRILTHHLPNALEKRGLVTESWRRRQSMRILTADLVQNPPSHPILIAGTTGTVPATRALLKAVYDLSNGIVVLPGLEESFDSDRVTRMRSHPQHTLFDLCSYLGVDPTNIPNLGIDDDFYNGRRHDAIAIFQTPPFEKKEEPGVNPLLIECASQTEEARVITAIVREKLFETEHSIAIVTPNQTLMRRLQAEFALYGITSNDSAGRSLKDTPVGSFLINFVAFLQNPSCATLIHLAKHPLCAKANRAEHLSYIRQYELLLRKKQKLWDFDADNIWIQNLKKILEHRVECKSFYDFIRFFKHAAMELTTGEIFKNNDGESASVFFDILVKTPPFIRRDFEDAVLVLMAMAPPVHTHEGLGSRIRILGTLEARLNTAEVVICASLNEGNWPKTPENDPILSDSFRLSIGLPSQKRRQGLAAHDFCTSFYAPYLYMTRPVREGGEATLQSRLWTRLVGRYGIANSAYRMLANHQIDSSANPKKPPMPMPLSVHRPKVYYASHVEQLMRDPYAYYTRHLLLLNPLPTLDEALSAKEKGQIFHDILDQYLKTEPEPRIDKLLDFSKPFFENHEEKGRGIVQTFWWYRFKRVASWWHEKLDSEPSQYRETEANGEMTLLLDGVLVELKSRADRIEKAADTESGAALRIIDYKTGALPTRKSVANGSSPQLLVEAVIAHNQGFGQAFPFDGVFALEYWRLTGGDPAGECLTFKLSFDDRLKTENSIARVLTHFSQTGAPYLAVGLFAESRIFARVEEWEAGV
ncbi:MAG: PD-(D/E)XK nuclease family protein [Pseudomonadota bacterium]